MSDWKPKTVSAGGKPFTLEHALEIEKAIKAAADNTGRYALLYRIEGGRWIFTRHDSLTGESEDVVSL